jgi:hypothetical protein
MRQVGLGWLLAPSCLRTCHFHSSSVYLRKQPTAIRLYTMNVLNRASARDDDLINGLGERWRRGWVAM